MILVNYVFLFLYKVVTCTEISAERKLSMNSVTDISSIYDSYAKSMDSSSASGTTQTLNQLSSDSSDEELLSACKSFETYFVQKMIEEEKKTLNNEDEQGDYMQYFGDTYNQALAQQLTDSNQLGLAQQMYESMKARSENTVSAKDTTGTVQ